MIDYKNINDAKPKKKNKDWLKAVGIVVFFASLVAVLTVSAYFYNAYTKKHYILRYVAIKGNKILSAKSIKNMTQTDKTAGMYEYSEKYIYSKLMLNPWIKQAYVAKLYPDTIYLKVVEKTPKALLKLNNKVLLIDSDGNIIGEYKRGLNIDLNKLPNIVAHSSTYKNFLINSVINMYEKLDKFDRINYIEIISESYQLVHFSNSLIVAVNSLNCPKQAFVHLRKEWNNLVGQRDKLDSVSICFANKFVLRWKKEKKGGGN